MYLRRLERQPRESRDPEQLVAFDHRHSSFCRFA
jgi:hypothetical protein